MPASVTLRHLKHTAELLATLGAMHADFICKRRRLPHQESQTVRAEATLAPALKRCQVSKFHDQDYIPVMTYFRK